MAEQRRRARKGGGGAGRGAGGEEQSRADGGAAGARSEQGHDAARAGRTTAAGRLPGLPRAPPRSISARGHGPCSSALPLPPSPRQGPCSSAPAAVRRTAVIPVLERRRQRIYGGLDFPLSPAASSSALAAPPLPLWCSPLCLCRPWRQSSSSDARRPQRPGGPARARLLAVGQLRRAEATGRAARGQARAPAGVRAGGGGRSAAAMAGRSGWVRRERRLGGADAGIEDAAGWCETGLVWAGGVRCLVLEDWGCQIAGFRL